MELLERILYRHAMRSLYVCLSFLVAGCLDGGGGTPTLTSGNYTVTSVDQDSDACGVGAAAAVNDVIPILVNGNAIDIGPSIDGTISGNQIDAPDSSPLTQTYNDGTGSCEATTRNDYSGTITANNVFDLVDEYSVTVANDFANCPFTACTSRFTYTLDASP